MPFNAPYVHTIEALPPGVRVPYSALGTLISTIDGIAGTAITDTATAEKLVRLARTHSGIFDTNIFRDGFEDDAQTSPDLVSILDLVNEAARQLHPTGYVKCRFTLPVTGGRSEYTLDPDIHDILSATFQGRPLKNITVGDLDEKYPRWRFYGSDPAAIYGTAYAVTTSFWGPRYYYTFSMDQIGLYPPPKTSDTLTQESLEILADARVSDLVDRLDVPERLSSRNQNGLALFAALMMCNIDAENEAARARMPLLSKLWDKEYTDVQQIVQSRDLNKEGALLVDDYRGRWRRR